MKKLPMPPTVEWIRTATATSLSTTSRSITFPGPILVGLSSAWKRDILEDWFQLTRRSTFGNLPYWPHVPEFTGLGRFSWLQAYSRLMAALFGPEEYVRTKRATPRMRRHDAPLHWGVHLFCSLFPRVEEQRRPRHQLVPLRFYRGLRTIIP